MQMEENAARVRPLERAGLVFALLAAVAWWRATGSGDESAGWALAAKAAVLPALAALAWGRRATIPGGALLAAALVCHGAGDLALELHFLAGMGAFAAGHVAYFALFWRRRVSAEEIGGGDRLRLGTLALAGAATILFLTPQLAGAMATAVPLYAIALLLMAGAAQLARRGWPWVAAGAWAYVISDALLALALFGGLAGGGARRLVWPLYVLGQGAIALGWIYGGERARPVDDDSD